MRWKHGRRSSRIGSVDDERASAGSAFPHHEDTASNQESATDRTTRNATRTVCGTSLHAGTTATRRFRPLFSWKRFGAFFLTMVLTMIATVEVSLRMLMAARGNLPIVAASVFANICFMCLLLLLLDGIWNNAAVRKPVRRILAALERIEAGDFSARVEPSRRDRRLRRRAARAQDTHEGTDGLSIPDDAGTDAQETSPQHAPVDIRANELDLIAERVNSMAQELGSVESLRGDFVANVSHEFKTPLASIRTCAALLTEAELPAAERTRCTRDLTSAVDQLSSLVDNVLRLNRLENNRLELSQETFDLGEELCRCFLAFEDTCEDKGLDVTFDLEDEVLVRADRELLSLVWKNLISNAVKFSEPGGQVTVTLSRSGARARVRVADTGCGMDEATMRHIFDKFYQGDSSHATQGNGLGLALVRRIADLANLDVSVESEPNRGTTFTVELPVL